MKYKLILENKLIGINFYYLKNYVSYNHCFWISEII